MIWYSIIPIRTMCSNIAKRTRTKAEHLAVVVVHRLYSKAHTTPTKCLSTDFIALNFFLLD